VLFTHGVQILCEDHLDEIVSGFRSFSDFTRDNDPHEEHDFGAYTVAGKRIFFKFDYYDLLLENASPDPSDPEKTFRALTIMLAEEY